LFCIHVGKFLVTTSLILSVRKLTLISYWVGDETYIFVIVYTITILNLTILNATLKVDIDQIKVKSLLFLDFSCSIFIIKLRTNLWMWSNGGNRSSQWKYFIFIILFLSVPYLCILYFGFIVRTLFILPER
jgi:hypothetical protein